MRNAFFRSLLELAHEDRRLNLIVGDVGFGSIEPFIERFPERFLNAGVAEQNMTGVASGMALCGKTVFTYSIANFPILRCLEQIRNDVCYHKANVKIVSTGGGFAYGAVGMTHHATEDLAIMRSLPNMVVVAPGDPLEAYHATRSIAAHQGPCYLRLGRSGEPNIHGSDAEYRLGQAIIVREGEDVTLVSTGGVLGLCLEAARHLHDNGVDARVLSMHTLKPIDENAILEAAAQTRGLITVEEHSIIGGLGSAVAEVLAQHGHGRDFPLRSIGLPDSFCHFVGNQEFLRAKCGLTVDNIVQKALSLRRN